MNTKLEELVASFTATAKRLLEAGEELIPVAFLVTEHDGKGEVQPCALQFDTTAGKREVYRRLRVMQRKLGATLVLVNDAYYTTLRPGEPFPAKGVSSLPQKREILMIVTDGPAGRTCAGYPYRRERGTVVWEAPQALPSEWQSALLGDVLAEPDVRRA